MSYKGNAERFGTEDDPLEVGDADFLSEPDVTRIDTTYGMCCVYWDDVVAPLGYELHNGGPPEGFRDRDPFSLEQTREIREAMERHAARIGGLVEKLKELEKAKEAENYDYGWPEDQEEI